MTPPPQPWWSDANGLRIRVRVTPKSARDLVGRITTTADGPALMVRVRALPEDGAANAAVEKLIAAWLSVPKTAVTLTTGARARVKTVSVAGDPQLLEAEATSRLERE